MIPEMEQQETDFDWFGVDEDGSVGHFTKAGFKYLRLSNSRFSSRFSSSAILLRVRERHIKRERHQKERRRSPPRVSPRIIGRVDLMSSVWGSRWKEQEVE